MDSGLVSLLAQAYDALAGVLPAWMQTALLVVFGLGAAVTNLPWTPERPAAEDGWGRWVLWCLYRGAELASLVGANVKRRPDVAGQAEAAAAAAAAGTLTAGDAAAAFRALAERALK